ncbi:MAG: GAF domain-containing protein [Candidatus Wallbacteria bacterium]|nr:GAF domain-containing protein [Candidatus Wallbacteria bacterium]
MARLIVKRGPNVGVTYDVGERTITIGRDLTRTVPILDGRASRLHAEIVRSSRGWSLRDLGATNKTYVNGTEIVEQQLAYGDVIAIGESEFVFERDSVELPGPPDLTVVVTPENTPSGGVTIQMPQPGLDEWMEPVKPETNDEAGVRHARRLRMLWRVSRTAFVKADLATFLEEILTLVMGELPADAAVFLIADEDGVLKPAATHRARHVAPEGTLVLTSTVVNRVFTDGNALLAADATRDLGGAASISAQGIRSVICVPLKSPEKTYGVFYIDRRGEEAHFDADDLSFLATVCVHVAVNIENLAMYRTQMESYDRLKLAQDQLLAAEKMSVLGRLAGSVAHELNNPLQCILMCSEILKEDFEGALPIDRKTSLDKIEMVRSSVQRCSRLVQNLLHYSHKRDSVETAMISLRQPVDEAVKLMSYLVKKRGIVLEASYPDQPLPAVLGNAAELEQVFINLIKNAADAIPGKGRIGVVVTVLPGRLEATVTDSGTGIRPEDLPHIFEDLFTTKPIGEGTGLGLPLCKRIVERHGGGIQVSSRVGDGTMVTLEIPLPAGSQGGS